MTYFAGPEQAVDITHDEEFSMESLIHCIYASAGTQAFGKAELAELLERARAKNARLNITGMLLYAEGSFFQVLEGDEATVDGLLAKIAADERHEKVTVIMREPIAKRAFGEWTMGFSRMTREDIESIDGLNDFFGKASCLAQIDIGRAKKLLRCFAEGRWRSRLSGVTADKAAA
jgi:hypothetical protein